MISTSRYKISSFAFECLRKANISFAFPDIIVIEDTNPEKALSQLIGKDVETLEITYKDFKYIDSKDIM